MRYFIPSRRRKEACRAFSPLNKDKTHGGLLLLPRLITQCKRFLFRARSGGKTPTYRVLLPVFGGYIVTSLFFFKFPTLLHRKKELKFRCCHISHRGGAAENLENTMTAFEHAIATGTDMLEMDLQITKDGYVVLCHDDNLLRSAGVNKNISDLDYNELPPLKPELPVDFDLGTVSVGSSDRKIPLLREVFERFPNIPIDIELKNDSDLLIKKVAELVKEFNREEFTVWGSFEDKVTKKCYNENPQMPILFSSKRVFHLLLLMYSGLLPFVNIRESCLQLFMPQIIQKNANSVYVQNKFFIWAWEKLLMRKALFSHMEKRGIQTYLWVLNDEEEFDKAFKLGVTGVITDYPTRLAEYLRRKPHITCDQKE